MRIEFPVARHPAQPAAPLRKLPSVVTLEDVRREADRVAIQEYAPPGVVINDAFEILQIRGRLAPYLELTPGRASLSLFKLARSEIVADLRYLISLSQRQNRPVKKDGLVLRTNGRETKFGINVVPLPVKERCFSIFFEEVSAAKSEAPPSKDGIKSAAGTKRPAADRRQQAEAHRQVTEERKYQQSLIEEYETTQEELTASNEELQSANEELQSTNEELETAKEELQSANEEMTTVNDELQSRNADMTMLSSDLTNLISSVDIPILIVGPDGRIRRFTPKAAEILRLIGSDVGRPVGDLNTGIDAVDLDELVSSVVVSMTLREVEIQDKQGSWYRVQVRPYRTVDNKIDGAVIALFDITALKHAAEQLKKLGDDAVMIIETMPMPILVVTSDRRVRVANDAFCKAFLVERSETEGRPITELGAGEWSNPVLLKILEDVFIRDEQYKDFQMEIDFHHAGRKSLVLNARSAFLSGLAIQAAVLAIEDSTERKRIASQLTTAEEMFRNLMENARDGIVVLNQQGTIEFANRRAEEMFGYSTGELKHQPYDLLVPGQSREVHRNHHAGHLRDLQPSDISAPLELNARRKDGLVFPVDISMSPVKRSSDVLVTAIIRDISERKKTETERLKIIASEKDARIEAERANRIKDEFLATLSHELRTPLTAILSWAQILRLGKGDPKKGLTMIEKSANDQSQLIDDLLDVSRIHAGKIHLNLSILNAADCVSLAVDSVRPLAEEKSQTIETVIDPSGVQINADPARIQQVFRNLLMNAIKFTPGGGRITVRLKHLRDEVNERVQIQFSDTGKGIKADFLPILFTRFTQAESSPTRAFGGLGLGLSIVRNLVQMHGGTVSAESPGEGKGSVFTVILPCNPSILRPEKTTRKTESSQPNEVRNKPANLNGLRMLIVDDVKETRDGFEAFFQSIGARVRTAASAAQGFNSLAKFKPDVLLCDIAMPGEDGYSLIRRIRALKKDQGGKIPAIAVTAYAAAEDVHRALAAKYNRHVAKPVDLVKLSHVIVTMVSR
jgi:two-component system CheB/CheR fusion protein